MLENIKEKQLKLNVSRYLLKLKLLVYHSFVEQQTITLVINASNLMLWWTVTLKQIIYVK